VGRAGLFLLLSIACCDAGFAQPYEPVDPSASEGARDLLSFLYENSSDHILAGQHNYNSQMNLYTERVHEMTGVYPAVWGTDFIWRGPQDPGQEIVDEAIRKHHEGYIITLMWHAGRPMDDPPFEWSRSIQGEISDAEWKALVTPGTELNLRWQRQVDTIASYLTQLRDAGVPVLWRPYHEMNGVWFWWGDKKGGNGFVSLWKTMFERFTKVHKLNNLIWVWNANAPRDIPLDEAFDYKYYFPGPEYVDVLATDVYNFDYEQRDYEQLLDVANGKVIALGEVGELPKPEILNAQPKWAWFMVWTQWLETHNSLERVISVYAYPPTLSLAQVSNR